MSIKLNTNILSKKITEILNEETINKIAKDCNFIISVSLKTINVLQCIIENTACEYGVPP